MSTESRDANRSEAPLSPAIEASDTGLSQAQDLRQMQSTFRFLVLTPDPTPTRARTPNDNVSETAPIILENVSGALRFSGADAAESRTGKFDLQYWLNLFTPSMSRSQIVEPSPDRRNRSPGVTSELSTGESSRRAASSGRQRSQTPHSAEAPDRQTVSTDTGSQNSRLESAPDTNQSQATPQTPRSNLRHSPNDQTNPVQFIPWQSNRSQKLSMPDLVAETMCKPVNGKGNKEGFLCVFWNQCNFGYCEIGYTTVDTAKRRGEWERQCRRRAKPITQSSQQEEEEKLPHVGRLKALVHATLKEYRCCEQCCAACHSRHQEWFEVDFHTVQSVKAYWSEWIRREPYAVVEREKKWVLKDDFKQEVGTVCRKVDELLRETQQSQAAIRPGSSRNKRRGNKRPNPNRRNAHLPETRRSRRLQ